MKRTPILFSGNEQQMSIPFEEFADDNHNSPHSHNSHPCQNSQNSPSPQAAPHPLKAAESAATKLLYYVSLGSGSSGNSCYIGTRDAGIIIDAGLRNDYVELQLKSNGINMKAVRGLLLTHDHTDHVKYAYNLLRNNKHIKLFCSNRVMNGLLRRHSISRRIKEYHVPVFKEIPFKVADFEITAFDVPHDGSDNMGFSLEFYNQRFVLATDLGAIPDRAYHYMSQANYLVIESNYDLNMLLTGPYPEYLKSRIQTDHGHLDNRMTAAFLKATAGQHLKYVFLCHLSQENNIPSIAVKSAKEALEAAGLKVGDCSNSLDMRDADVQLMALPRTQPSPLFIFRP